MLPHTPVGSHVGRPHDGLDGRLPARVAQAEERVQQQWLRLGIHGVGWVWTVAGFGPRLGVDRGLV